MEPVAIRDFLSFQFVSSPTWSPDGASCVFLVQQAAEEDNCYTGDLYLYEAGSGTVRRLTAQGDAKSYCWTAQGTLLFPALREKADKAAVERGEQRTVYYEIDPSGGEAVKAFSLPVAATALRELDDGRFLVSARYDRNYPDLEGLSGEKRDRALKEYKAPAAEVFEELPFWGNGLGYTSGKRDRLYLFDRSSGALSPLTDPEWDAWPVHVLQDKVVFQGGPWREVAPHYSGVYILNLASRTIACVVEPGTLKTGPAALLDEDTLLLAASYGKDYGTEEYCQFYTAGLSTGKLTPLAGYEASIGNSSVGSDARLGGRPNLQAGKRRVLLHLHRGRPSRSGEHRPPGPSGYRIRPGRLSGQL